MSTLKALLIAMLFNTSHSFTLSTTIKASNQKKMIVLQKMKSVSLEVDTGFIATELRGAAMKLHTTRQAPKDGGIKVSDDELKEPYVPTIENYLSFLVDSQHVYNTMEEIVNSKEMLSPFRNTGLERTEPLERDIEFIVHEFKIRRPSVGEYGKSYASKLKSINSIPEFICHYYNYYFAHTAGGRMIGKQMSALLLNGKTLEFYKVCRIKTNRF
jgi:heme oxygenase (biliverdin-producing, ferredoxin)